MSTKGLKTAIGLGAFVVASVGAFAASNGGHWSPAMGGTFLVHCGEAGTGGYDCKSNGYCITGDSWCQQLCKDANGNLIQAGGNDNAAVSVMCIGQNGSGTW